MKTFYCTLCNFKGKTGNGFLWKNRHSHVKKHRKGQNPLSEEALLGHFREMSSLGTSQITSFLPPTTAPTVIAPPAAAPQTAPTVLTIPAEPAGPSNPGVIRVTNSSFQRIPSTSANHQEIWEMKKDLEEIKAMLSTLTAPSPQQPTTATPPSPPPPPPSPPPPPPVADQAPRTPNLPTPATAPLPRLNCRQQIASPEETKSMILSCESGDELASLPLPCCFVVSGDKVTCKVCTSSKGWSLPQCREGGKKTAKWSRMAAHLIEHVNVEKPGRHMPTLRAWLRIQQEEGSLSGRISFHLVHLAYKNILSGNAFRDFENLVFSVRTVGGEVGDLHHSREFPPKVVDAAYSILTETLLDYFGSSQCPFPLPFSIVADKDESHHRKRLLIGLRLLNFHDDQDEQENLVSTVYLGHPASVNQSGEGIAQTIYDKLIDVGVGHQHLARAYRGLCADGGVVNVNLSDHLLQLFWGTASVPVSKQSNVMWVWDGAHIIELILKHGLERTPSIQSSKNDLESIVKFFREPTVYEMLRQKGLDSNKRVYSPKVAKDHKFVARDSIIANDFLRNFPMFVDTLVHIIGFSTVPELVPKAQGYLKMCKSETFMIDVYLLVSITGILKRFSVEFQQSTLTVDGYINLVGQLKLALSKISLKQPCAATQYWFQGYYQQLSSPLLVDPCERSTRRNPTVGLDALDSRTAALEGRKVAHEAFLKNLCTFADYYWFEHKYWQRQPNNIQRLENMAHLFNMVSDSLELPLGDPVKPSHKRCSVCCDFVSFREKNHGCTGATLTAVSSLADSFKRVSDVVPGALAGLCDNPEQITADNIAHLKSVARATRSAGPKTLQGWIKHLVLNDPNSVQPGVMQLLLVGASIASSEAIAETYGSVMEKYHNTRFFNTGTANDDVRLQKEMFIKLNGPPLGQSDSFCRRVAARLNAGPTQEYMRMHPYNRRFKTGKVVKKILNKKGSGFFK